MPSHYANPPKKKIKTYSFVLCVRLSQELRCSDDLPCPLRSLRNRLVKSHIKAATSKYLQSSPGGITTKSLLGPGKHVATCVKALKPGSLCLSRRLKLAQRVAENRLKGKRWNICGPKKGNYLLLFSFFSPTFCSREIDPFCGVAVGRCGPHNFALHSE